jgi:CubicO group peptidase (beta-lactamase class C family)
MTTLLLTAVAGSMLVGAAAPVPLTAALTSSTVTGRGPALMAPLSDHVGSAGAVRQTLTGQDMSSPALAGPTPTPTPSVQDSALGDEAHFGVPTREELQDLDRLIADAPRALGIPGAAAVVVTASGTVHAVASGRANGAGRPLTVDTPVMLASTSQAITAIAVLQQAEQGRLDLDAPVARYLPWFRVADGAITSRAITVRQLLSHTSGLPATAGADQGTPDGPTAIEDGVRSLGSTSLSSMPGVRFGYSAADYDVLGLLVQTVSGRPYADYLRDDVYRPLGMTHSYPDLPSAESGGLAAGWYPWFGRWWRPTRLPRPEAHLPSASQYVSAEDLGHTLSMHLAHGRFGHGQVLSQASESATVQPVSSVDDVTSYAMGWYVRPLWEALPVTVTGGNYVLPQVVEHDGDWTNSHSFAAMVPSQGWGVALVVNGFDPARPSLGRGLDADVLRVLTGQDTRGSQSGDPLLQRNGWLATALLLLGVSASFVLSVRLLSRRRERPAWALHRRSLIAAGWLVPDLVVLWLVLWYIPAAFDTSLADLLRSLPDVALTLLPALVLVIGWAPARTVALLALRGGPEPAVGDPSSSASVAS